MLNRLLIIFASMLVAACNPFEAPDKEVRQIERFQEAYNAGEDDRIWRGFGPEFYAASKRDDWDNLLTVMRDALGKNTSTEQVGVNYQANPQGQMLVITMQTQFERGMGHETFTFLGSGDERRLIGYNIASDAVVSKMMEAAAENSRQPKSEDEEMAPAE